MRLKKTNEERCCQNECRVFTESKVITENLFRKKDLSILELF